MWGKKLAASLGILLLSFVGTVVYKEYEDTPRPGKQTIQQSERISAENLLDELNTGSENLHGGEIPGPLSKDAHFMLFVSGPEFQRPGSEPHTDSTFLHYYNFIERLMAEASYAYRSYHDERRYCNSLVETVSPDLPEVGHYLQDVMLTKEGKGLMETAARSLYRIKGPGSVDFLLSVLENSPYEFARIAAAEILAQNGVEEAFPDVVRYASLDNSMGVHMRKLLPEFGDAAVPYIDRDFHNHPLFGELIEIGSERAVSVALKHLWHSGQEAAAGYAALVRGMDEYAITSHLDPSEERKLEERARMFERRYKARIDGELFRRLYAGPGIECADVLQMVTYLKSNPSFRNYICSNSIIHGCENSSSQVRMWTCK